MNLIHTLDPTQLEQLPLFDFADGADGIDVVDGCGRSLFFSKKRKVQKVSVVGLEPTTSRAYQIYPVGVPVALVAQPQRVSCYEHFRV